MLFGNAGGAFLGVIAGSGEGSAASVVSATVSRGAVWTTGGAFGLAAFGVDVAGVAGAGRVRVGSFPPAAGPPLAPEPTSDGAVEDVGVVLVEDVPPAAVDLVDGVAEEAHIGGAANGVNVEGFEDAAAAEDVAVAVVVPPEDAEVAEVAEVGPAAAAPLAAAAADIPADPSTVVRSPPVEPCTSGPSPSKTTGGRPRRWRTLTINVAWAATNWVRVSKGSDATKLSADWGSARMCARKSATCCSSMVWMEDIASRALRQRTEKRAKRLNAATATAVDASHVLTHKECATRHQSPHVFQNSCLSVSLQV